MPEPVRLYLCWSFPERRYGVPFALCDTHRASAPAALPITLALKAVEDWAPAPYACGLCLGPPQAFAHVGNAAPADTPRLPEPRRA